MDEDGANSKGREHARVTTCAVLPELAGTDEKRTLPGAKPHTGELTLNITTLV